jgi:hypothetical protein
VAERGGVICFANKGAGSNEESRIFELLEDVDPYLYAFDRADKRANVGRLLRLIRSRRPELVVMEGTGISGGLAVMAARRMFGTPYVVSSGDAVGPYLGSLHPALGPPGWLYEAALYRGSAGFIGWTPYLAGRALTMGAPRAMTAAGYSLFPELAHSREEIRRRFGVPQDALLFGIVGALPWNPHRGYCYGYELVRAIRRIEREDVAVLVIGGGSGVAELEREAGDDLGRRVFVPGPVPHEEVAACLAAMDVGSLPQSTDQVGSFRYTTKISEYLGVRLPFVTGQVPMAYDIIDRWSWRLPGDSPWDEAYVAALAALMAELAPAEAARRRAEMPERIELFDREDQQRRVGAFVSDLLAR